MKLLRVCLASRATPTLRNQGGVTLLEILVVMAVLVPVVLAASLGLVTTMKLSASTKTRQELDSAATSYAESLKQIPYVPCGGTTSYDGNSDLWAPSAASNIVVHVTAVSYWSQSSKAYVPGPCTADKGAQSVVVTATRSNRTATLTVVKRNPSASASVTTP